MTVPRLRWLTNTLHPSAAAPLSEFRSQCDPPVQILSSPGPDSVVLNKDGRNSLHINICVSKEISNAVLLLHNEH